MSLNKNKIFRIAHSLALLGNGLNISWGIDVQGVRHWLLGIGAGFYAVAWAFNALKKNTLKYVRR